MPLHLNFKYSRVKVFMVVSLLLGFTLCFLQFLSIFLPFDSLLLGLNPDTTYTPLPTGVMILIVMFHTLLPGILILEEGMVKGFFYSAIIWFFYGVLIHSYTTSFSYYMPLVAPLLGCGVSLFRVIGWEYTLLKQDQDGMKKTFGCFVEPKIADILLNNPDLINQDGVRKEVTIMFADLRGFTQLCESIPAELVISMLRDCFSKLISIVRANGGTVDKLIGDSMMVVWGNPVPIDRHAARAVESAIEMQAMMQGIKQKWAHKLGVEIMLGIGINTDEVVAGTIGSEEFCDYTVLGSGVNLASNLESVCPGEKIFVSEQTFLQLNGIYEGRKLENIRIKNNGKTLSAYQILGYAECTNPTPCQDNSVSPSPVPSHH